jgi:hypothetical protein
LVLKGGRVCHIIDTPGLDDSPRANLSVLKSIATELVKINQQLGLMVGGVVYFHPITDHRLTGPARVNIEIFEKICGGAFLHCAAFATTMWNTLATTKDAAGFDQLHRDLEAKYKHLTRVGTKFFKFEAQKTGSAEQILNFLGTASPKKELRLKFETEVLKSGLSASSLRKTDAGKVIVRAMGGGGMCVIL